MKLKFEQVSTIPKKLVLLLISMLMLMAVAFTVPVYANQNDTVIFDGIDYETTIKPGWYSLYPGESGTQDEDFTFVWQVTDPHLGNITKISPVFSSDTGVYFKTTSNTVIFDGIDYETTVGAGWYSLYPGESGTQDEDFTFVWQVTDPKLGNVSKVKSVFSSDTGVYFNFSYDNKVPVISGETTFVSNVADPKDAAYFMQFLSAYDETDGDVSDSLKIIADNYTANKSKLGNHTFTVEASDKSGNKTTAIINVRVVDIDKPVITGNTTTATVGYKETYNIENFRKTLTVTDNYDQMTNADIKLKTDGYTSNKTKLGTYNIVFHAKDSSGNEGIFTKAVRVIDNVKPTFSGPSIISTSNNTILTEADIRAQITAHDDIDGNITNRIELVEDNYTGNGNKVGSYTIKYSVKDNANNIEYYTVTIQRTDKIPPTIWVEDGVSIRTNVDTPISYQIIIDILQATGQITVNASTTFSFPLDEYTGNENEPGIYAMSVKARSTDGNESIFNLSIVVYDTDEDGGIDVNPGFDIKEFVLENKVYFIIGGITLLSIGAYVGYRKFKR